MQRPKIIFDVSFIVTVFIWLWDWRLGFKLKTIDKRSNEDEILQAECNPITVIPTINCCWWILLSDDTLSGSYAGDKYCCQSSKVFLCGNKYQSCMMLTIGWRWDDINLYNWNCSLLFYNALQVHLRMHEIMPETNILLLQILFFTVWCQLLLLLVPSQVWS